MNAVFDAHYRVIHNSFAEEGIRLAIAYVPNGDVDYVYEENRLLVTPNEDDVRRVLGLLEGARVIDEGPNFVTVSIDGLRGGYLSVPDALAQLDPDFHPDVRPGQAPRVAPNHLFHVERLCSAIEPEVPSGPPQPWPPPRQPAADEQPVRIGLVDNGLVKPIDPALTWLNGVDGDDDPLGAVLPGGLRLIPPFTGHGTFVAGVARCMAPRSEIFVGNELKTSGAELESRIVEKMEQLIATFDPAIINVSSGSYCRNDWAPIGFEGFFDRHPDLTLVAAAGNDSTDRPLYPAAYPWAMSVGALGPDQAHRAWFSNYGPTVDLYVLGEGIVNAFTVGQYRYQEPPKRPARQDFRVAMARWDGTSFAAPLVTGMIASRMGRTGETSAQAARALLDEAEQNPLDGVGPVLLVPRPD